MNSKHQNQTSRFWRLCTNLVYGSLWSRLSGNVWPQRYSDIPQVNVSSRRFIKHTKSLRTEWTIDKVSYTLYTALTSYPLGTTINVLNQIQHTGQSFDYQYIICASFTELVRSRHLFFSNKTLVLLQRKTPKVLTRTHQTIRLGDGVMPAADNQDRVRMFALSLVDLPHPAWHRSECD